MKKLRFLFSSPFLFIFAMIYCTSLSAEEIFYPEGSRGEFPNTAIVYPEDNVNCPIDSDVSEVGQIEPTENSFLTDDFTKEADPSGLEDICEVSPPQKSCIFRPDVEGKSGYFDDCIYRHTGPLCQKSPPKCCEFGKDSNGAFVHSEDSCDCTGEFSAGCKSSDDCAICLCSAEAGGEPDACVDRMMCVANGDASGNFCKAVLAFSGNAWRYSAARCICDLDGDGRRWDEESGEWQIGYNQNYCACCAARAAGAPAPDQGAWRKCQSALDKVKNGKCSQYSDTHYAVGKCPCDEDRIVPGSVQKCGKHVFCQCR